MIQSPTGQPLCFAETETICWWLPSAVSAPSTSTRSIFVSEVESPLSEFDSSDQESPEICASLRLTACEQGLLYRDRQSEMIDKYADDFIYMQDGNVVWER